MEFSTTQEIHADLATVWAALGDPQNWVKWMDDLTDVKPEDGTTAPGPGARYSASQAWWRFDNQRLTIHDYRPNERLTYSAETTGSPSRSSTRCARWTSVASLSTSCCAWTAHSPR